VLLQICIQQTVGTGVQTDPWTDVVRESSFVPRRPLDQLPQAAACLRSVLPQVASTGPKPSLHQRDASLLRDPLSSYESALSGQGGWCMCVKDKGLSDTKG